MAKGKFCVIRKRTRGAYSIPFGDPGWAIVKKHGKRVSLSTFTREARARGYRVDFRRVSQESVLVCYRRKK
jgi:hypothetical protein